MVPVESVSENDEEYTSSTTGSQCPLIELTSGSAPQLPSIALPSGTGEPLFPRFELESVSVTPVAPAAVVAAQNERKQQKKGRGFGDRWNREGNWRGRSQQDQTLAPHRQATTSLSHRRVKIPPLPKSFSLMALNQKYYKNPPPKQPELSKEERNANMIASLRNEVVDVGPPLIFPRPLPSKVQFLGFTEDGTVMITFLDERNLSVFERNKEKIAMWFGQKKVHQLDTRIRKDDISRGRIVLASVPRSNGSRWNVRAMISDFNDKWIIVDGVDYPMWQRKLSYDNVFYQLKDFNFSPFQLQVVHLEGLEKYEGSTVLRFIIQRLNRTIEKWADEKRLNIPENMVLKKISEGKEGYRVRLAFPEEFLDGLSLNKVLMEEMKKFDPFVDYLVTP